MWVGTHLDSCRIRPHLPGSYPPANQGHLRLLDDCGQDRWLARLGPGVRRRALHDDEWQIAERRYLSESSMAMIDNNTDQEVATHELIALVRQPPAKPSTATTGSYTTRRDVTHGVVH